MKRLLLALSFGLVFPACAAATADSESSADGALQVPGGTEMLAPPAAPHVDVACLDACLARYDTCFANADTDRDICLCGNALVRCELPCGAHGIIKSCPL
jgi:hypothetical protein